MGEKAIALKELSNEDYLTQLARGYENIPKGAEVECIKKINNLYGEYIQVQYDGHLYHVKEEYLRYVS